MIINDKKHRREAQTTILNFRRLVRQHFFSVIFPHLSCIREFLPKRGYSYREPKVKNTTIHNHEKQPLCPYVVVSRYVYWTGVSVSSNSSKVFTSPRQRLRRHFTSTRTSTQCCAYKTLSWTTGTWLEGSHVCSTDYEVKVKFRICFVKTPWRFKTKLFKFYWKLY